MCARNASVTSKPYVLGKLVEQPESFIGRRRQSQGDNEKQSARNHCHSKTTVYGFRHAAFQQRQCGAEFHYLSEKTAARKPPRLTS